MQEIAPVQAPSQSPSLVAASGGVAGARPTPRITFAGVTKTYPARGGRGTGTLALDKFDLAIAPAEIVSIVGPTGCGKSTAMNLLAGFEHASSGSVSVNGRAAREGGLAQVLFVSMQALHATRSIPQALPLEVIQAAIDPSALKSFVEPARGK